MSQVDEGDGIHPVLREMANAIMDTDKEGGPLPYWGQFTADYDVDEGFLSPILPAEGGNVRQNSPSASSDLDAEGIPDDEFFGAH